MILFNRDFLHAFFFFCLRLVIQIYGIDAASGAAVSALNVSEGDHVLDLCAAPGNLFASCLLLCIDFVNLIRTVFSVQLDLCSQIIVCSQTHETRFGC